MPTLTHAKSTTSHVPKENKNTNGRGRVSHHKERKYPDQGLETASKSTRPTGTRMLQHNVNAAQVPQAMALMHHHSNGQD